jgi:hypothetical protein
LQGQPRPVNRHSSDEPCPQTSARDRKASRLPEMYPRRTRVLHGQATTNAHLQAFHESPLTDSNRRPPPYHRATSREPGVRPGSRGHESRARRRNRPKTSDRAWTCEPGVMFPQCSLRIGSARAAEASASRVRPGAGVVGAPPLKRKDVAHATLASRRESSSWRRAATRSCLSTSSTGFRRWRAKLAAAVKSAARAEREALRQNASRASKYAASSAATIQSAYVRDGNPRYLPKRRSTRTSENLAVVRAACCGDAGGGRTRTGRGAERGAARRARGRR